MRCECQAYFFSDDKRERALLLIVEWPVGCAGWGGRFSKRINPRHFKGYVTDVEKDLQAVQRNKGSSAGGEATVVEPEHA